MRSLIVAVLLASLATPAAAQTAPPRVLTLEQAVARVRAAGFDVRLASAEADIASAEAAASRAVLRPQLAVTANLLDANVPQLGMPVARQAYAAGVLTVPIYTPSGSLAARAADRSALAARTMVSAAENDAVFAVTQAYRRIQLADAILTARHVAVTDQEGHLRVTELRVAAGKTARYLLARDRAVLANAQQAREDAASERDQAANDLAALLDLASPPEGVEPLTRIAFAESKAPVLERALRQRQALVAAGQRVRAAESVMGAARGAYRPSATFTAQSYNGVSSPALGRSGSELQLTASLPIGDGGARAAASAKARAEYDRAVAMRDRVRAGVMRDVANAWREYEAASRNTTTATAAVFDGDEQLRIATLREHAGKAIANEVLDALAVAASARETFARSIARFDLAVAAIHHAAGDGTP